MGENLSSQSGDVTNGPTAPGPSGGRSGTTESASRGRMGRTSGPSMPGSGGSRCFVALLVVAATDQIVPAPSAYQAQMRIWLAARATGFVAYGLLTVLVTLGLILSHPVNQSTWKLS